RLLVATMRIATIATATAAAFLGFMFGPPIGCLEKAIGPRLASKKQAGSPAECRAARMKKDPKNQFWNARNECRSITTQRTQGLGERGDAVRNVLLRGIFVRPMAIALMAGNEQHRRGSNS